MSTKKQTEADWPRIKSVSLGPPVTSDVDQRDDSDSHLLCPFILLAVGSLPSAAQMEPPGSGLDWWRINNINNMKLGPGSSLSRFSGRRRT